MPISLKTNTTTPSRLTLGGVELVQKSSHSLENHLVDASAPGGLNRADVHHLGYRHVERNRLVSSSDISAMFGKASDWFGRHRNRAALERRGFPKAVLRGRWLRTAVETWLERQGTKAATSSGSSTPRTR